MRLKGSSSTIASARFACSGGDLPAFESFVDALPSVEETLRARIRLAGGEILDNLLCHALPLKAGVRVRFDMSGMDEPKARLGFFFHSRRFRTWVRAPGPALRSWSPSERRWRGLGLTMVLNLSERLEHRSGPAGDRIVLTF